MFKAQRGEKGFTLIELLIVIAIIGILAAIAIPAYTGYTRKAKVQEVIGAMGSVKTAVMAYYTESQPAAATGWTEDVATSADVIRTKLGVDVPTKYLTSMTVNNAGVITATLNDLIGGDTAGGKTVILRPTMSDGLKKWVWEGSLSDQYKPKN